MSIKAGSYEFHDVDFAAEEDVLYAFTDRPRGGIGEETPELHVWHVDEDGEYHGVTFISPRYLYEREGALWLTLPSGERVAVEGIEPVLGVKQRA